mmetsp:Transcript_7335/g.31266  ORF Transcript_7335/g.31266 Transcript_7335/m.31266 type:complete len:309 (-) Transcript_7335:1079-2005(-)
MRSKGERVSFRMDARETLPYRARRSRVCRRTASRQPRNTPRAKTTRERSRSAIAVALLRSRSRWRRALAAAVRARHSSSDALSRRVVVMYDAIRDRSCHSSDERARERRTANGGERGRDTRAIPTSSADPDATGTNVEVVSARSRSLPTRNESSAPRDRDAPSGDAPSSLCTRRSDASARRPTTARHRRARSRPPGLRYVASFAAFAASPAALSLSPVGPSFAPGDAAANAASAAAAAKRSASAVLERDPPGESGQVSAVGSGPSENIRLEDVSPLCIHAENTASSSIARFAAALAPPRGDTEKDAGT